TKIKYKYLESVVQQLGIEKERLQLNWISASEGEKFANFIRDVTEQIKKIGPSPLKPEGVA
ncbi:MAG: hydrogenase iron-sulfur subunit, partial [Methanobacteriota archaeon]